MKKKVLRDNALRSIEVLGIMMDKALTRPKDIWGDLSIKRSTASTLLIRLESMGLVENVGYANWKITKKGIKEYDHHTGMRKKMFEVAKEAAIDVKDGDVLSMLNVTGSIDVDLPLEDLIEKLLWKGEWSEKDGDIVFNISFPPGFQVLFIFQSEPKVVYMFATMMKGDSEDVILRLSDSGPESMLVTLLGNINSYFYGLDAAVESEGGRLVITGLAFVDMIRDMFWGEIGSNSWPEWLSHVVSLSGLKKVPLELTRYESEIS